MSYRKFKYISAIKCQNDEDVINKPSSSYSLFNLPDLRGKFIRGFKIFDTDYIFLNQEENVLLYEEVEYIELSCGEVKYTELGFDLNKQNENNHLYTINNKLFSYYSKLGNSPNFYSNFSPSKNNKCNEDKIL
jgi:hypothetical protein